MNIAVASGKGGTGKTTIAINLVLSVRNAVFLDCDVEEPNGHLFLNPDVEQEETVGRLIPEVDYECCDFCGECARVCEYHAITVLPDQVLLFEEMCHSCGGCAYLCPQYAIREVEKPMGILGEGKVYPERCGFCVKICPEQAIDFKEVISGIYRQGRFDHSDFYGAKLWPEEGTSGKLVSQVKQQAQKQAKTRQREWFFVDGPPGIGCPVNASLTGADLIVAVTEPTVSGYHDLQRVIHLALRIKIPIAVVINKYDLNSEIAQRIKQHATQNNYPVIGQIPFDKQVVLSLMQKKTMTQYPGSPAACEIKNIWSKIKAFFAE